MLINTTEAISRLAYLCNTIPSLLTQIPEDAFSWKPSPQKWSKKEIIGHLIDSAANNHHRMVRMQFEESFRITTYDQDNWNAFSYYNQIDSQQIITFWTVYNKQLLALMNRIPVELMRNEGYADEPERVTLAFLIEDYVQHMEHHLHQVVIYE